jgi:RNA polymerase sigma-70 factor (sigma-E family)
VRAWGHMDRREGRRIRMSGNDALGRAIADALWAACHPVALDGTSVVAMVAPVAVGRAVFITDAIPAHVIGARASSLDVDLLVAELFREEGASLVRLVRLFVDDRNAAEDLVQEGFIRLARSAHRIKDPAKAPAYLRSIVLNLARDNNRRGLVSLRHHLPFDSDQASMEDELALRDDQQQVIEALRELPPRQRDCLVLRYYDELGIDDLASTLGISPNSVKTHLKRGLRALEERLAAVGVELPDMEQEAVL